MPSANWVKRFYETFPLSFTLQICSKSFVGLHCKSQQSLSAVGYSADESNSHYVRRHGLPFSMGKDRHPRTKQIWAFPPHPFPPQERAFRSVTCGVRAARLAPWEPGSELVSVVNNHRCKLSSLLRSLSFLGRHCARVRTVFSESGRRGSLPPRQLAVPLERRSANSKPPT